MHPARRGWVLGSGPVVWRQRTGQRSKRLWWHVETRRAWPWPQQTMGEELSQLLHGAGLVPSSCGTGDGSSPGDAAGTACSFAQGSPSRLVL